MGKLQRPKDIYFLPPAGPRRGHPIRGALFCQRWQVQVTGAGEELENGIKKEANFNRSPMPWGPLDREASTKTFD